jgi:hypothetical protein
MAADPEVQKIYTPEGRSQGSPGERTPKGPNQLWSFIPKDGCQWILDSGGKALCELGKCCASIISEAQTSGVYASRGSRQRSIVVDPTWSLTLHCFVYLEGVEFCYVDES